MAIIIDEFETVLEPLRRPNPEIAPPPPPADSKPLLKPEDIVQIDQRQRLRLRRVWAN